jgi:hypothetical protein
MHLDDQGIAYGVFTIVLLLVVSGVGWILFIPLVNGYGGFINDQIDDGRPITEQTVQAYSLIRNIYNFGYPVFVLITVFYYGIIRAVEQKRVQA